jgi:hypothetical protein
MTLSYGGAFRARIFRYPGKGGWHFVVVPERLAPTVTHGWGRTPVTTVNGASCNQRGAARTGTPLAVPAGSVATRVTQTAQVSIVFGRSDTRAVDAPSLIHVPGGSLTIG